jgi:hypothetical protein
MNHTEVRINELNVCRKLLDAAKVSAAGTSRAAVVYGLADASRILHERKKQLRAALEAKP